MGRIIEQSKKRPGGVPMGRECPTNEEFGPGGVTYG
jgi:hypothetical protein